MKRGWGYSEVLKIKSWEFFQARGLAVSLVEHGLVISKQVCMIAVCYV